MYFQCSWTIVGHVQRLSNYVQSSWTIVGNSFGNSNKFPITFKVVEQSLDTSNDCPLTSNVQNVILGSISPLYLPVQRVLRLLYRCVGFDLAFDIFSHIVSVWRGGGWGYICPQHREQVPGPSQCGHLRECRAVHAWAGALATFQDSCASPHGRLFIDHVTVFYIEAFESTDVICNSINIRMCCSRRRNLWWWPRLLRLLVHRRRLWWWPRLLRLLFHRRSLWWGPRLLRLLLLRMHWAHAPAMVSYTPSS